jgi:hypothetical protein
MEKKMIRNITKRLVEAIAMDCIPDNTVCCDFGIDPEDPNPQFGALQWGWKNEAFKTQDLDNALGNGEQLTELINRVAPGNKKNPYACVIVTAYDFLPEEEEEEL